MQKGEESEKSDEVGRTDGARAVSVIFLVLGLSVALLLAGVLLGVVLFIVPKFEAIFADFDVALPKITAIVLNVSYALRRYWFAAIPAGCVVIAGLIVPYVLLPRRRKLLVSIYVVTGWVVFACAVTAVVFALFMPLITLMDSMSS